MNPRKEIKAIFEKWQGTSFLLLHAGEMSAQEIRTVKAVLKAVQEQVDSILPDYSLGYLHDTRRSR